MVDKDKVQRLMREQKMIDANELSNLVNNANCADEKIVAQCVYFINVGYGWGKFALSVLRQNKFTIDQIRALDSMSSKLFIQQMSASISYDRRQGRRMSDADYEESDICGWDGHGF